MSSKMYAMYETDPVLEKEGIWADYGDFRVLIARAGGANKRYQTYADKKVKPYRRAIQQGIMPENRANALMADIYAETIILAWEVADGENDDGETKWKPGIHGPEEGEVLEYNKSNVILTLKKLPNLLLDLQSAADNTSLYSKEELDDEAGN